MREFAKRVGFELFLVLIDRKRTVSHERRMAWVVVLSVERSEFVVA
jgi:hypothetical protein